jgi:hypothetical protein
MPIFYFTEEDLNPRDPSECDDTVMRNETADDCDGIECGASRVPFDVLGIYPNPHDHTVISGTVPFRAKVVFPIFSGECQDCLNQQVRKYYH